MKKVIEDGGKVGEMMVMVGEVWEMYVRKLGKMMKDEKL